MSVVMDIDEGPVVECDGCGDTALAVEIDGTWGIVVIGAGHRFDFCSNDCLGAWNYHVTFGCGVLGRRPGEEAALDPEMPF